MLLYGQKMGLRGELRAGVLLSVFGPAAPPLLVPQNNNKKHRNRAAPFRAVLFPTAPFTSWVFAASTQTRVHLKDPQTRNSRKKILKQ